MCVLDGCFSISRCFRQKILQPHFDARAVRRVFWSRGAFTPDFARRLTGAANLLSPSPAIGYHANSRVSFRNGILPTIVYINGYRLFFVSFDGSEPMHVHVRKDRRSAKVWMNPIAFAWSEFRAHENRALLRIVEKHTDLIREKWYEHFGK